MTGRAVLCVNLKSQGVKRKGSRLKQFYDAQLIDGLTLLEGLNIKALKAEFTRLAFTPEDHLFIEGGDGTMQATLSALLNSLPSPHQCPKLSLIAGGLTNQIAANIGLKARSDAAIVKAIKSPQTGLKPAPILKLTAGKALPAYGCLFSSGALPFVTDYYAQKVRDSQTGGKAAIAATLIKAVTGNQAARDALMPATALELKLHNNGQEKLKTGAHLSTIVTTLPSLMMGLDPFWGGGQGDLRVFYADAGARRLVQNLTGLWLGRKSIDRSGDGLESYRADRLDYHYDGPLILDGEALDINGKFALTATPPLPFITGSTR